MNTTANHSTKITKTVFAMGTDIHFVFFDSPCDKTFEKAVCTILDLEEKLSVFKPKSTVSNLNKFGSFISIKVPSEVFRLVKTSVEYSIFTDGYFDITAKRLVDLWKNAAKKNKLPTGEEIEDALLSVGSDKIVMLDNDRIKLKKGTKLDFGAIAKGFAADIIFNIFREDKIYSSLIDLGGHILAVGKKKNFLPWKVGIRHPLKAQHEVVCYLEVEDTSVVTSESYERHYCIEGRKFSHILNPKTGYPAKDDILSVTVVDRNSSFADALSTALFAMGLKRAVNFVQKNKNIEAVIIFSSREIFITPALNQKLVLCDSSFRVVRTDEVIVL